MTRIERKELEKRAEFLPELMAGAEDIVRSAFLDDSFQLTMEKKPDGSKVTNVDKQTNAYFIESIISRFPGDAVMGEEGSTHDVPPELGYTWCVDPVDGTNELHRTLMDNRAIQDCSATIMTAAFAPGAHRPSMAAVSRPCSNRELVIASDLDARKYPAHIQAATLADIKYYTTNWWPGAQPDLKGIEEYLPNAKRLRMRSTGHMALKFIKGEIDLFLFPGPNSWPHDCAAPAYLVQMLAAQAFVATLDGDRLVSYAANEPIALVDQHKPIPGLIFASTEQLGHEVMGLLERMNGNKV
jgi:fructose-1,6-bisphosphatase/inositol monophosphatase family enzyme